VGHGRGRCALGPPAGRDRDLVVFLPGIIVAVDPVEKLDHLGGLAVGRLDLRFVLRINPIVHGQGPVGIPDDDVRRGRQEDEVRRVRQVLGPVIRHLAGRLVLGHADEPAVRGHLQSRLNGGHDLVGDLVVRVIETGEPVMDVFGEGVREHDQGIVLGFGHEPQPDLRVSAVIEAGERQLLPEFVRARQLDREFLGRLIEFQGHAVVTDDGRHRELLGVEDAGREAFPERGYSDSGRASERFLFEIELDLDQVMESVIGPAALGLKRFFRPIHGLAEGRQTKREDEEDDKGCFFHDLTSFRASFARRRPSVEGHRSFSKLRCPRPPGERRARDSHIPSP